MMLKRLLAAFFLCSLAGAGAAAAATQAAAPAMRPVPPRTSDAVSHHTISLVGRTYAYTARAGTIDLTNAQGEPTCRMFYTADTLDGANPSQRPITFIYNGGPGSSTVWLRMGSFGPVRVVVANGEMNGGPPYRFVPNRYSLLDRTDEVFIDMCASGYSRLIGAGTPKDFFGADADVRSFAQFIDRYITKFDRWNSPKFLFGESYGTPRSAMLVNVLQNEGIGMNGVILQSSILNFGLYASTYGDSVPQAGGDWSYVTYLPTETATAWYHHRLPDAPADLETAVNESRDFAMGEYLNALALGSRLPRSTYDDVVAKLHRFTGLSERYIRLSNLRVPYQYFLSQLERNENVTVGRYDSRYESAVLDDIESYHQWDPTDAAIDAAFTATNNVYIQDVLGYRPHEMYRVLAYDIIYSKGGWDFSHNGNPALNTAPDLANAMTFNPSLRVFSANGYYDFATPWLATVYTLQHLNLRPDLEAHITYGFYPSGHMIYLNEAALASYHADLENWYESTLAGR
ncbi:MAG: S10 family peptidase [Candidatus Tyrphobacter sp.]